jgi:hypothetical protein
MSMRDTDPAGAKAGVDIDETRRRFLLAREQAAQSSAARYRSVRALRSWPTAEPSKDRAA